MKAIFLNFRKVFNFFCIGKNFHNFKMHVLIGKLKKLRKYRQQGVSAFEYKLGQVFSDSKYYDK